MAKQMLIDATRGKRTDKAPWVPYAGCHCAYLIGVKADRFFKDAGLLAKGVVKVSGEFARGEVARITNRHGDLIARGITSYSSRDLAKIAGKHSNDILAILGYDYGSEIIHRDDMVVITE